jgi:hypothetical protein
LQVVEEGSAATDFVADGLLVSARLVADVVDASKQKEAGSRKQEEGKIDKKMKQGEFPTSIFNQLFPYKIGVLKLSSLWCSACAR